MPLRYRQQVSPHIPSMVPFASFWTRSKVQSGEFSFPAAIVRLLFAYNALHGEPE
jgi:hypothetical protein